MRARVDAENPQNHNPHTTIEFPYNSNRDPTEKHGDFLQHEYLPTGAHEQRVVLVALVIGPRKQQKGYAVG